jgi:SagB-type dehydrogenase family enzyme
VLSRFALCRAAEGGLLVESPRALVRIVLHTSRAAGLLVDFQRGVADLGSDDAEHAALAVLFAEAGLLVPVDEEGHSDEDVDPDLRQWSFHDLLFHSRSRFGRHDDPYGGVYPFEHIEPPARLRAPLGGETVVLDRPDVDALIRDDRPFSAVLEARRSIREPQGPVTREQLGHFLYRCLRLQSPENPSFRPTPSGGAIHELELYVAVRACDDLDPGLYRYAPVTHELERLPTPADAITELFRFSGDPLPAVHLVMAARFANVTWKYASMPYSVILKNVGCLMQTMYLVATAMDMAPCAIGAGDSDLFARLTGLPYEGEGAVGEFSLY